MKRLVLYIIIISFGLTATAAPLRYCKKTGKALAAFAIASTQTAPQRNEKTPLQGSEVCAPTTLVFLHSPSQVVFVVPDVKRLHNTGYHSPFYSQYIANPPFAPPRLAFV